MTEDRLHVLDVDVPVEASTRIGSRIQKGDSQCIAVCYQTGVIAIANGRFVDLYGASNNSLHPFTFLHQISIGDHVTHPHSIVLNNNGDRDLCNSTVSCVACPVPGFLLVGAFVEVPESEISETNVSVNPIYFSFVEPVVGVGVQSIRCLQSFRNNMTPDSGSVVVLFGDSEMFGVFSWKERFSDRLICLAQMKHQTKRLGVAECSPDGRYIVVGDDEGRLSLIDFKGFPKGGYSTSSNVQQMGGKRLKLGLCSRSGVTTRDNPLEHVRLVHISAITAVSCVYTSLRWWICGVRDQQKQFILAGKQDGSLSVRERIDSMN
ncbi:Hypothetical protein PHPALM_9679 [Phytophthora palmivora]|uniref:Uncharacterized protein n=1 Tax=Phytophthora palmivora TaxID=4796 RepID=A0A2P4Y6N5_9STRA|nr:Hypothetical protein PHPALM_9679 [Phytophthora palmivora]